MRRNPKYTAWAVLPSLPYYFADLRVPFVGMAMACAALMAYLVCPLLGRLRAPPPCATLFCLDTFALAIPPALPARVLHARVGHARALPACALPAPPARHGAARGWHEMLHERGHSLPHTTHRAQCGVPCGASSLFLAVLRSAGALGIGGRGVTFLVAYDTPCPGGNSPVR